MVVSWGRAHKFKQNIIRLASDKYASQLVDVFGQDDETYIAHGLGRSYGDVALNESGTVCLTPRMNNLLEADWDKGIVRAAAGLSIDELLKICVPKGWFIPVTPGTKFVTLGGAVANDVHGKNHHQAGSIGTYITRFQLRRSDKGMLECAPTENTDLFNMTIGGLGLTGFIEWVEIQLKPIKSAYLDVENIACESLSDFFRLSEESKAWPYTVMWVDCFAKDEALGRGIFSRGKPASDVPEGVAKAERLNPHNDDAKTMPVTMPSWSLNKLSISLFNAMYRARPAANFKGRQHYNPFFYPLDGILGWNKLYGSKGFYQHQCILPPEHGQEGIGKLLEIIANSGQGSFLAVLKIHGPETSPGIMSFGREGVSLALDFANRGNATLKLLEKLDAIVREYSGCIYPAKDGRMSAETFQAIFPHWQKLEAMRDPKISSSFWRRVTKMNGQLRKSASIDNCDDTGAEVKKIAETPSQLVEISGDKEIKQTANPDTEGDMKSESQPEE